MWTFARRYLFGDEQAAKSTDIKPVATTANSSTTTKIEETQFDCFRGILLSHIGPDLIETVKLDDILRWIQQDATGQAKVFNEIQSSSYLELKTIVQAVECPLRYWPNIAICVDDL